MSRLTRLFNNNRFVMVLSFVLAVIAWFTVSIVYSPKTDRTIDQIPIQMVFPDDNIPYRAYSDVELLASVQVTGKRYEVQQATADSVVVTAKVDTVTTGGMYTLDLEVSKKNATDDFSISKVTPSTVTVMVDVERTMELEVAIECVGASVGEIQEPNQSLLLEPSFVKEDHKKLTVTGPESEVSKIQNAAAVATVNKQLEKTEQYDANLVLYSQNGSVLYDAGGNTNSLRFVTLSYTSAPVVAGVHLRKVVPLKYTLVGAPKTIPNMTLKEVTGSENPVDTLVSEVSIKGDVDVIEKMDSITLDGTVDFTKIDLNNPKTSEFKLTLPTVAGVVYDEYQLVNLGELYFIATVDTTNYISRSFDIPASDITVDIADDEVSAGAQSALKGVTIAGPANVVRYLTANDISVKVTASSLSGSGAASLVPNITVPGSNRCWVLGSYQVVVEVKNGGQE